MATTLRLGPQPDPLVVDLYAGCDWWSELQLLEDDEVTPDDFDVTEGLVLRLAGTDFDATIVDNTARWDLTATEVDALLSGSTATDAAVLLVDSSGPDPVLIPWWVGVIERHT